ncbi:hypothetical protein CS368_10440 [Serratia marcescens]|nr:hypothetical protein CS368_10440 [Serratia marcescens]
MLLTKGEKAWFFPLCGYQPKINKLIFLVFYSLLSATRHGDEVCHQCQGRCAPLFYSAIASRVP